MTDIRHAAPEDMGAVRDLCRAYRTVLLARSEHVPAFVDTYYGEATFEDLLGRLETLHARPKGAILVGGPVGDPQGCAMTHEIRPGLAEVKRIFVADSARGTGLGRRLTRAAMDQARKDGYTRLCLDSFATLSEAISLYESMGFRPCAPFYEPDPDLAPHLRFYNIALDPPDQGTTL